MDNSDTLSNLKNSLSLENLLKLPNTRLLIDKKKREIILSTEDLKKNVQTFLKHLVKIDKDMVELIFEGWSVISGKYPILPIEYCGFVSEDITLLFNDDLAVILDTPQGLIEFHSNITKKSLEELLLIDYVEAVGKSDDCDDQLYKGCLTDYEETILSKIISAQNQTNSLLIDMLSLLIPLKWEPHLGWFILGREYSIISTYEKWILLNTEGLLKNFTS